LSAIVAPFRVIPESAVKSEQGASLEERRYRGVHFQSLFLHRLAASIWLSVVTQRTDSRCLSEAEGIVFAAEDLLLTHEFPFNCGIRRYSKTVELT
jgi:hypothetical protein